MLGRFVEIFPMLRCLPNAPVRRPFRSSHGCASSDASSGKDLNRAGAAHASERGQALIEFIMLIPMLMAFTWYLIHVNMAITKSIVGQQAARSQLFLKLYNHRSGPVTGEFGATKRSHFYVGVSDEMTLGSVRPVAPVETLGIGPNPPKMPDANDDPGEATLGSLRQRVRVRTVFGICTHRKMLENGSGVTDFCGAVPEGGD